MYNWVRCYCDFVHVVNSQYRENALLEKKSDDFFLFWTAEVPRPQIYVLQGVNRIIESVLKQVLLHGGRKSGYEYGVRISIKNIESRKRAMDLFFGPCFTSSLPSYVILSHIIYLMQFFCVCGIIELVPIKMYIIICSIKTNIIDWGNFPDCKLSRYFSFSFFLWNSQDGTKTICI